MHNNKKNNNSKGSGQAHRLSNTNSGSNSGAKLKYPVVSSRQKTGSFRVSNTSFQSFSSNRNIKIIDTSQQFGSSFISNNDSEPTQQQIHAICWDNCGDKLAAITANSLIIYNCYPESGLKQSSRRKLYDSGIQQLKYLRNNQTIITMSPTAVKLWDCRTNKISAIQELNNTNVNVNANEQTQQLVLFDVCESRNIVTVGDYYTIKNYDYRMLDKFQCQPTNQTKTGIPVYDIKWCELGDNILIAGGGHNNKGIITLYDDQLNEVYQLDQCANQIISMSLSQCRKSNNSSVILERCPQLAILSQQCSVQVVELPELACTSTISLTEEQVPNKCEISSNGVYIAITYDKHVQIVEVRGEDWGDAMMRKQFKERSGQDLSQYMPVEQYQEAKSFEEYDRNYQNTGESPKMGKVEANKQAGETIRINKKTNVCWNPRKPDTLAYIDRQFNTLPKLYQIHHNTISKQLNYF